MNRMTKPNQNGTEESTTTDDGRKSEESSDESGEDSSASSESESRGENETKEFQSNQKEAESGAKETRKLPQKQYVDRGKQAEAKTSETRKVNFDREVAKMYTVEVRTTPRTTPVNHVSVPRGISKSPRRLILVRHGERMERVFPAWLRLASCGDRYKPYNLGQPESIPSRCGGMQAFHDDPSITRFGRITAELIGRQIAAMQFPITGVYCSPALRCIETAHEFLKVLDSSVGETKIEHGLFEWLGWYGKRPSWMSVGELKENVFCVDGNYKPVMDAEALMRNKEENTRDFYRRSAQVVCKILSRSSGTTLIITHGPNIDASARYLLKLDKTAPRWEELDAIGVKYPYCSTVVLEQDSTGSTWKLAAPMKSVTFLNQSTKFNPRFLQRKSVH